MDVRKVMDAYDVNNMAAPFGDIVAQKYKSVYIPFSTSGLYAPFDGKSYYFRPDFELDAGKAVIKAIVCINIQVAQTNQGWGEIKDNLPISTLRKGMLYISNTKREIIAYLPLAGITFTNTYNELRPVQLTHFTDQIWQNCYVEFNDVTGITAVNGLQFLVFYDEI
jgi:hypothetical protein